VGGHMLTLKTQRLNARGRALRSYGPFAQWSATHRDELDAAFGRGQWNCVRAVHNACTPLLQGSQNPHNALILLVGVAGLEPATR
jgi:hypothetical protein